MRWQRQIADCFIDLSMRCIICCLFLVFFTQDVVAQYLPYKSFTTANGLSQAQVMCLHKDQLGFLWVGTKNGINRFDGKYFKRMDTGSLLASPEIRNIKEGKSGKIYINTASDLGYFTNQSYHALPVKNPLKILPSVYLHIDKNEGIWIIDFYGIYRYNSRKEGFDTISYSAPSPSQMAFTEICEKDGYLYYCRENILYRTSIKSLQTEKFAILEKPAYHIVKHPILEQFILADHHTVYALDLNLKKTKLVYENKNLILEQIFFDNHNHLLVKNSMTDFIYIDKKIPNHLPLIKNSIVILCDKQSNIIWVGTEHGLNGICQHGIYEFNSQNKILPTDIWNIYETSDSAIWFHSYSYGIANFKNNKLADKSLSAEEKHRKYVYFQSQRIQNDVYFNHGYGLLKNDGNRITPAVYKYSFLPICSFYDKQTGYILLGTQNGIQRYHPFLKKYDTLFMEPIERMILSICRIDSNRLFCTSASGYYIYYEKQKFLEQHHYLEKQSPFRGAVSCLKDSNNRIWVGAKDGLYEYLPNAKKIVERIPLKGKLIGSMLAYNRSTILLGIDDGIFIFRTYINSENNEKSLYKLDYENSGTGISCNQNSFFRDSKNRIWAPSISLVNVFKFDEVFIDTNIHKPIINEVYSSSTREDWIPTNFENKLEFAYPFRHIRINFLSASMNNSNKIVYQYRLHKNDEWSKWSTENSISLYDLVPGNYQFQIRCKQQGYISDEITTFSFSIIPRWHEIVPIRYLIIGSSLLLLCSIGLLWHYHRKNKQYLQQKEKDELELEILKQQLNPHFLRNTLKSFQRKILDITEENKFQVADNVSELSRLFSLYLEASVKKYITIEDEIKLLSYYLDFQIMRFKERFTYEIIKSPTLSGELTLMPMIIQPFVENASEKAFLNINYAGSIKIEFKDLDESSFCVIVLDNGIGRTKSKALNQTHISHSTRIIEKIHQLYNEMHRTKMKTYQAPFTHTISDLYDENGNAVGTRVEIIFPKQSQNDK
ncbi:MAG: histidine kinase [Bacteroidetes bacterium]|nr:histidine kinase [Bacteroidota bacterium]